MTQPISGKLPDDRRREQGAWLFLASLGVFFLACMLLYAIYVVVRISPDVEVQPFYLPQTFLLTTVNLAAISVLLHLALSAVKRERQPEFTRYIVLSTILAVVFFLIQSPSLTWMMLELQQPGPARQNLYSFTFFLVIVHALHVVGGVVGLGFVLLGIRRQAYDHESYFPVTFCTYYWHFLDVVWILMMIGFGLAAYASK